MALLKRKRSGLNDPMSVVTRFVNACNRHDADGVSACLHPDFDSIQPMFPARNFRGADQVRRNWQAIFDAEPGFRLTVLRSAALDDTVWLELHGAGRDAEVAGVFVMGIQGDRIRWARIYSALVEPVPPGTEDPTASSASLREVPPLDGSRSPGAPAAAGTGEEDEALMAPVVDIEGSGRRRRRSSRRRTGDRAESPPAEDAPPADDALAEDGAAAGPAPESAWGPPVERVDEPTAEPVAGPGVAAGPAPSTGEVGDPVAGPQVAAEPAPEERSVEERPLVTDADAEAGKQGDGDPPSGEAPRWRFGKKSR